MVAAVAIFIILSIVIMAASDQELINKADVRVYQAVPTWCDSASQTNYVISSLNGNAYGYHKFDNVTGIPSGATIDNAVFCVYGKNGGGSKNINS